MDDSSQQSESKETGRLGRRTWDHSTRKTASRAHRGGVRVDALDLFA
jgi:hypothetical protein